MPDGWPEQALLCTDDPSVLSPAGTDHTAYLGVRRLYMKELVVSPRGVRRVRMIWQANRLHYALLREIKFEGIYLEP